MTGSVAAATDQAAASAVREAIGAEGVVLLSAETARTAGTTDATGTTTGTAATQPTATTQPTTDTTRQDTAVRDLLRARLGDAAVVRTESAPVAIEHDGVAIRAELLADAGLADAARLVAGAWPAAGQTAVQRTAADALGLAPGDILATPSGPLEVSGTWEPLDVLDPRWAADPAAASGRDGDAAGPFLVAEDALRAAASSTTSEWVVVPGGRSIADLARGADRASLAGAFAVSGEAGDVSVSGGLDATARRALRTSSAAEGLTAAALLLLLVVVVVGSSRLIVLGAGRRRDADALLRARGASRGQLVRWSSGEVLAVAGPAAVLGVLAGAGASAALVPGAVLQGSGLLGVAVLLGALVATAALQPVPLAGPRRRGTGALGVLGTVLLLAAAGVAVGQLVAASGELGAAGIAAVPLLLVALSLAAVTAAAAGLRRRTGIGLGAPSAWLFAALRSLRVRASWFTATALVVALASALCVAAAALPATITASDRAVAADTVGAAASATFDLGPIVAVGDTPVPVAALARATGRAAAVVTEAVSVGDVDLASVVLPSASAAALTGSAFAPAAADTPGLGVDATGLGVRVTANGPVGPGVVAGSAWLASADGALAAIDLGTVPVSGSDDALLSGALPDGFADADLLAVDLRLDGADTATVEVGSVSGLDAQGASTGGIDATRLSRDAVSLTTQQQRARILVDGADDPLPVALTASAASALGLTVGDDLDLSRPSGRALQAVVASIVPVVPGAGGAPAVAIDTRDFARANLAASNSLPTPSRVWIATDDLRGTARVVATEASAPWTVRGGGSPFVSAGASVWTVAAVVAVLMALVALTAGGAVLRRLRAGDEAALAALGVGSRERRARRLVENGIVAATGIVVGAVVGAVASALCLPAVASLAVGGATRPAPAVDVPLLLALAAGLLLAVAAGVAAASHERGAR
ncbi:MULTISPECIES: hypothetical protein [unclassified Rathayibacter]|uniref:hypothetical protein n=1 Tax=unclassified Rathayibacter TaxID=2609250 RepID=UPI0015E32281|nr:MULTISPECIES: hypothetical protein [unclassified Rathayibacter]